MPLARVWQKHSLIIVFLAHVLCFSVENIPSQVRLAPPSVNCSPALSTWFVLVRHWVQSVLSQISLWPVLSVRSQKWKSGECTWSQTIPCASRTAGSTTTIQFHGFQLFTSCCSFASIMFEASLQFCCKAVKDLPSFLHLWNQRSSWYSGFLTSPFISLISSLKPSIAVTNCVLSLAVIMAVHGPRQRRSVVPVESILRREPWEEPSPPPAPVRRDFAMCPTGFISSLTPSTTSTTWPSGPLPTTSRHNSEDWSAARPAVTRFRWSRWSLWDTQLFAKTFPHDPKRPQRTRYRVHRKSVQNLNYKSGQATKFELSLHSWWNQKEIFKKITK